MNIGMKGYIREGIKALVVLNCGYLLHGFFIVRGLLAIHPASVLFHRVWQTMYDFPFLNRIHH